ncbi:hypothetical protein SprV_0902682700 [Sparganum proliferum]
MNYGLAPSALPWLVFALLVGYHGADALPAVCNYTYQYITKELGPLNITILTVKKPNQVTFDQKKESYLVEDGACVDIKGEKPSFPCPYECEQSICFLTIEMPDVSGVDAIYVYSNSDEYVGGVYRKTGMYARESYFDLHEPVVYCVNTQYFDIPWTVRSPKGVGVMSCAYQGAFVEHYANLEDTLEPQTVTVNAFFGNEVFEGYSCWIDVSDISVIVERFVLWLDAAYFETSDVPKNRLIGPEEEEAELSWNFVTSTPEQTHSFMCLGHDGVKCAGVTEVQEPGKCETEKTENGLNYAVTTNISVGELAAYVCYIGERASAQSIYKLGTNDSNDIPTNLIEETIVVNLNGASVALNDLGSHYLWLQNVQVGDVKCEKHKNTFSCRLSPDNLKIYWMADNGNLHSIIDVLPVNESLRFSGSFEDSIKIDGGRRDRNYFHIPHYKDNRPDTIAMLSDLLLSVFQ